MKSFRVLILGALMLASPWLASAQDYPNRPIKIVVSYGAGGTTDLLARTVANHLMKVWGQPVVVENKAGANGQIGYEYAARASPDGYTLFLGNSTLMAVGVTLFPEKQYAPPNDFTSVGGLASGPLVVIANPSVPAKNLTEFVAYAKEHPGKINAGLAGWGGMHHLVTETLRSQNGLKWTQIAYKDSPQLVRDVVAGVVDFGVDNIPSSLAQIQAGRLRALAVTSRSRTPLLPELPTLAEAGIRGIDATSWFGLVAPAGTPRSIIEKINPEINRLLSEPGTVRNLASQGLDPLPGPPQQFQDLVIAENAKWARVIRQANVKVER